MILPAAFFRYKGELAAILWPVFVHVYLFMMQRHLEGRARSFMGAYGGEHEGTYGGVAGDLRRLEAITKREQLPAPWGDGTAEAAEHFLDKQAKFTVWTSVHSFELLLTFLEHNKLLLILHILVPPSPSPRDTHTHTARLGWPCTAVFTVQTPPVAHGLQLCGVLSSLLLVPPRRCRTSTSASRSSTASRTTGRAARHAHTHRRTLPQELFARRGVESVCCFLCAGGTGGIDVGCRWPWRWAVLIVVLPPAPHSREK